LAALRSQRALCLHNVDAAQLASSMRAACLEALLQPEVVCDPPVDFIVFNLPHCGVEDQVIISFIARSALEYITITLNGFCYTITLPPLLFVLRFSYHGTMF
jgi:hypothetical protein